MKRDLIPDHGHWQRDVQTARLTREQSSFRAAIADARPPTLVKLLDFLDDLALDEIHLVVFLCVVVELHDCAETTAFRARLCRWGRWRGRRNWCGLRRCLYDWRRGRRRRRLK